MPDSSRSPVRIAQSALLLAALSLNACVEDATAPPREPRVVAKRSVAAVVEITFENIGQPNMSSSALVASSIAELEAVRAERDRAPGARRSCRV